LAASCRFSTKIDQVIGLLEKRTQAPPPVKDNPLLPKTVSKAVLSALSVLKT
jgi:hypothetical protein